MPQPEGFVDPKRPQHVCKLTKKSLVWTRRERGLIACVHWKFQNSKVWCFLFYFKHHEKILLVLIYVYDIFLTGNNHRSMNLFVTKQHDLFSLKDLGPVHYFLGIEISRDSTGFYLNQRKYINDLLDRWSIFHVSPCLHYARVDLFQNG